MYVCPTQLAQTTVCEYKCREIGVLRVFNVPHPMESSHLLPQMVTPRQDCHFFRPDMRKIQRLPRFWYLSAMTTLLQAICYTLEACQCVVANRQSACPEESRVYWAVALPLFQAHTMYSMGQPCSFPGLQSSQRTTAAQEWRATSLKGCSWDCPHPR